MEYNTIISLDKIMLYMRCEKAALFSAAVKPNTYILQNYLRI